MRGERSLLRTYYTRIPQPEEWATKLFQQCGQTREVSTVHAREGNARRGFLAEQFLCCCREKGLPPKREEFRFIDKYGTIPLGMNRYKV